MKKCLLKIFLLTLLLNSFCYAEVNIVNDNNQVMANILDSNIEYKIDSKISKELKDAIRDVYGKEKADEIYQIVINKVIASINSRPEYLKNQDLSRKSDWYKDEII